MVVPANSTSKHPDDQAEGNVRPKYFQSMIDITSGVLARTTEFTHSSHHEQPKLNHKAWGMPIMFVDWCVQMMKVSTFECCKAFIFA